VNKNTHYASLIPLWFHAGDQASTTDPPPYHPFTQLLKYDKCMGSMGFIPMALQTALRHFYGITVALILHLVLTETFNAWKAHCGVLVKGALWMEAGKVAEKFIPGIFLAFLSWKFVEERQKIIFLFL
jgi:hypothetical protein